MRVRASAFGALLVAAIVLSSCGDRQPEPTPPSEPTATTPSVEPTSGVAEKTPLERLEVRLETVADGFVQPLFVTHAGDGSGRLFVVEQTGRVRVVRDGKVAEKPFLDVSDRISAGGERGLLGLAFAPDYGRSGRFYVNYTDTSGDTVIARYVADDPASDSPALGQPETVLKVDQPYPNHNGGCIVFAPDGTLWVGMGDGGAAGDPGNRAQNPRSLLGKLLSLDVEADGGSRPKPQIVASGLRNPWRFGFDRESDDVWIGDVGQNSWEEIDWVPIEQMKGANFGWSRWEGRKPYPPGAKRERDDFVFPVIAYDRDKGQSVTGGYVYRGPDYPEMQGTYFYGDYVSGWIAAAQRDGERVRTRTVLPDPGITPSSFGEDEQGELYVCDYNGSLMRIAPK